MLSQPDEVKDMIQGEQKPITMPVSRGMAAAPGEKRQAKRLNVHWPVRLVRADGSMLETVSENISSSGFYCYTAQQLVPGEELNCYFTIPLYNVSGAGERVELACRTVVARVVSLPERYGAGCRIEEYALISG